MTTTVTDPDFCTDLTGYYPIHDYIPGLQTNIGVVLLTGGLLNVFMSLITVLWLHRQKRLAQEETDNDEAVKSVIFPVFVRLLWLSVAVNILSGILIILAPLRRAGHNNHLTSALFAAVWAMQHGVLEGVAFLLMQKGCGQHAAKRVRQLSVCWVSFIFVLMYASFYYGGAVTEALSVVRDVALVLFYAILLWAPQERLFRRPAALYYSKCWLLYRGIFLSAYFLMMLTDTEYLGNCGYILLSLFVFAVIQPLIMYTTLLRDSWWWQGIEINARNTRSSEHDIRHPLLGSEYSLQSAQALAGTLDEMRVRGNVTMLNFACIKLDARNTLGAGSFSKVYKGTYRGKDCAIKLIYTMDITADTIKKVAAEASILSSIRHKNIVNIMGVSVLPPSVCLILELCSFGSLSDIIRGYGFDWSSSHRAPLKLSYPDILYLALGCARGLAAVHAYDRSLCHRDVKSFNFLVDHQFNVKIADLELGIMAGQAGLSAYDVPGGRGGDSEDYGHGDGEYGTPRHSPIMDSSADPINSADPTNAMHNAVPTIAYLPPSRSADPECVDVGELLANWLAPEVILERRFRQASDIFSLGTVLWEILSGLLPFDGEAPATIRRKIVSGYVHAIPPQYAGTTMGELVSMCWAFDPTFRPTAAEISSVLESALKEYCYSRITKIECIPDTTILRNFYDMHYRKSVYGDARLHRELFADLSDPTCMQYINPCNWARYAYNLYQYPRYRGISVDDSSIDSSEVGSDDANDVNRQLFDSDHNNDINDADSESGITSRSSYVISDGGSGSAITAMYAQLPRAALDVIGVIKEEAYWEGLERSGAAWAVTTIDAPYIVMHATAAWYKMFNIKHSQGSYQHMYSIMSLIGRDTMVEDATGSTLTSPLDTTYTSSNAYVGGWKETTGPGNKSTHQNATNALLTEMHEGNRTNRYKQVHGVLCFSQPRKKGAAVQTGGKQGPGHNLMSTLHVYPIYASGEDPSQPAAATTSTNTTDTTATAVITAATSGTQVHSLSASKLALSAPQRNKTPGSPMRDFNPRNNANLASVNTGTGATTPGPLPHQQETPSLRRSNTQMSSASFASTIRSSKRPAEPDVPRPVYFAILFHELIEQQPQAPEPAPVAHTSPPRSSVSGSGPHSDSLRSASLSGGSASHSSSPSSSGLAGTLQALMPRFWSSDKSLTLSEDRKGEYQYVSSVDGADADAAGAQNFSGSFSVPRTTLYSAADSSEASTLKRHSTS